MLNKKISRDEKVMKLSLKATLLYTWCIAFLDFRGRIYGDCYNLKSIVPFIKEITIKNIPSIVQEWIDADLVICYGNEYHKYLEFKGFTKNQTLREGREAESEIPPFTPAELQSNSSGTPAQVKISKDKYMDFVLLTSEEYVKLVSKLSENTTKEMIDRLNNYIGSTGKRYKSHYYTLLNWSKKDAPQARPKMPAL